LLVELVPTGDVVNVTVVQSSGDAAFDRSAEAAVRSAGRLPVPPESAVFERYFRRLSLLFQPEDLLR
jgi:colicin import membrane protein